MYLQAKLQQASWNECIYKLKVHKIVKNDVFKEKHETNKVSREPGFYKLR